MAITSVSPNFSGKRDNVNAFVNLDDASIRQLAAIKTSQNIDTKKHKRIDNALDCALPLAGGLSAAAYAAKGTRLTNFAKGAFGWGLFLAGIGATFGLERFAKQKSEKIDEFSKKHPILSIATSCVVAYGAGVLAIRGGSKALGKFAGTDAYKTIAQKASKVADKVNTNKYVAKASEHLTNALAETPAGIKNAMKAVASWSPFVVVSASLAHALSRNSKASAEYAQNYADLKEKQLNLARMMNNELRR